MKINHANVHGGENDIPHRRGRTGPIMAVVALEIRALTTGQRSARTAEALVS